MIWPRGHVGLEALTSLVETHGPMDQATGFREISISFTFMVPAHPGSPGQRAVKWVCVYIATFGRAHRVYCFCCWPLKTAVTPLVVGSVITHCCTAVCLLPFTRSAIS